MEKQNQSHSISVKDILNVTKGKLIIGNEKEICENFSIDSREISKGDIYLGIKGEKVNGSIFFEEAFLKGAKGAILQDIEINEEQKLIKLIRKCNARGGTDNISIAYLVKDKGEVWYDNQRSKN